MGQAMAMESKKLITAASAMRQIPITNHVSTALGSGAVRAQPRRFILWCAARCYLYVSADFVGEQLRVCNVPAPLERIIASYVGCGTAASFLTLLLALGRRCDFALASCRLRS